MNERTNLWEKGLEVVRKLNEKHPVESRKLSELEREEYNERAETDPNIKANVLQHKALINAWTEGIAKSMKRNPKEVKALRKFILDAHGKVPLFEQSKLEGYELPTDAANSFAKAIGNKKRALTMLKVLRHFWNRTIYKAVSEDFAKRKDEVRGQPEHLALHAANSYHWIIRHAVNRLEEEGWKKKSKGACSV